MSVSTPTAMTAESKLGPSACAIILRSLIEFSCARLLYACGKENCFSRANYKRAPRPHAFKPKQFILPRLITGK